MVRLVMLLLILFCTTANAVVRQIETPERIRQFKRLLPRVDDPTLEWIFRDPATLWYSGVSIPPAHQLGVRSSDTHPPTRFSFTSYNASGDDSERNRTGNASDFPWSAPGGTHRTRGVDSFKFISLPSNGPDRWPIAWYRQLLDPDHPSVRRQLLGYGWVFPRGSVVGEVLSLSGPRGSVTFEVRTRVREATSWSFEIYRPFPTSQSFIEEIKRLRPSRSLTLNTAIWKIQTSLMEHRSLVDSNRTRKGFRGDGWVDTLPDLQDDDLVYELLDRQFLASFGEEWKDGCIAPTTDTAFHIIPARYDGGMLADCMQCHDATGETARSFDRRRGWYGYVRGSDGILSWHPIDPSAIGRGQTRLVRMRQSFIDSGILEKFDRTRHPNTIYTKILK